jgi:hypothetical protein
MVVGACNSAPCEYVSISMSCLRFCLACGTGMLLAAQTMTGTEPPDRRGPSPAERRNRPGPWDQDVLVHRIDTNGVAQRLAVFERAGVPTVARWNDKLIAAYQYFPENDEPSFDKVAVRFSSDEGRTWTGPQVIRLEGLPEGFRFPFDPTLVPLPDGRVRLYFTSVQGRRIDEHRPAIYSAVSTNGIGYVFEPAARFAIEGRPVIDCAVVLHKGVFHLFAPDNGTRMPGSQGERADAAQRLRAGRGYHATSKDGLKFTREQDVTMESGRFRWLGNAQSDGKEITFYGTADGPGGNWIATSKDGVTWKLDERHVRSAGADPGAVLLGDGSLLVVGSGPPRPGTAGAEKRRSE